MESRRGGEEEDNAGYEVLVEIGQGAYGKVYKARERGAPHRLVALKKLRVPADTDTGIPAFVIREVALLRKIETFQHPNVVKLLKVSASLRSCSFDLTLVFEYIDQDLSSFLSMVPESGLSHEKIKDLMRQLLQGLDFLHTNMVVHRDLKPENVLVSSRGEVKIADFGLARLYTYRIVLTPCVVTLWYRAPEVLLNMGYMSSVDVWSAGCIFAELFLLRVLGLPPEDDWPTESPIPYASCREMSRTLKHLLPTLCQEESDLLEKLLIFSAAKRIPACQALEHIFFADP